MAGKPIIFHIDVNSAFLSWSALEHLQMGESIDLRTIPSAVGGDSATRHGIILAKSIPAKAFHIETAEPITNALRKCPNLRIVSPNMTFYHEQSQNLMTHLSGICPIMEQVSIDECYLDYSYIEQEYTSPEAAAAEIKDTIYSKFGFSVNIGISDRKVLAKMASDFKKPNLVHTLYHDEIQKKMWSLPVSSLFMCGHSSVEVLRNLELLTIGDLAMADPNIIQQHLKSHGKLLWEYANGIDDSKVECIQEKVKGVGNSTTVSEDIVTREAAAPVLLRLSEQVTYRLRSQHFLAGSVSLEIKYNTFHSVSKQMILKEATSSTEGIYQAALLLFDDLWNNEPIRLLGVRTTRLSDESDPVQLSIFDTVAPSEDSSRKRKQELLDNVMDEIRNKYGKNSVVRGTFLTSDTQNNVKKK